MKAQREACMGCFEMHGYGFQGTVGSSHGASWARVPAVLPEQR